MSFNGVAAGDTGVTDGFAGLGGFVALPLELLEFERLQLRTTGAHEMEHTLVAGFIGAVHGIVFEVGSGDYEAA